ncbi:MAG: uroporphyrinogen decarboxylase family protein [Christensenellales bacterium]|jgi:uroporphyrinogen decarboxylase
MDGRERFLTVLSNQKPDRMPVQVHGWMSFYLQRYLDGADQYAAYEAVGMDPVIYVQPDQVFQESDLQNWEIRRQRGPDGREHNGFQYTTTITTPKGVLVEKGGGNDITSWVTKHLIEDERDFALWDEFVPLPTLDWAPVLAAKERIGRHGIVRSGCYGFGQGSPWQDLSTVLMGTERTIFKAMDEPDWVHFVLGRLLDKKLQVYERSGPIELDLVETGGGGGSSTVISPAMHKEFCLPYDQKQHKLMHELGAKVVYHLCGGLMPLLDIVVENGADGLETMTPASMGGDCDMALADKKIGDRMFFIGGFDQNAGFEHGTVENVYAQVRQLFQAKQHGGYICCPSDHFFFGNPSLIRAFADAARECVYS